LAPQAAEAAARRSYGKLVAFLAARTRDVAAAEDALSAAFAAALADWRARAGAHGPSRSWRPSAAVRAVMHGNAQHVRVHPGSAAARQA
jgi:RNA polymerase sigma-70 factor (ECF subfamily)